MASAAILFDMLGGMRSLGRRVNSDAKWMELLRAGLPYSALESVRETLGLSREEVSELLAVPLRTLVRRKREHKLRADESDRLFRLARIAAHAVDVLGSKEAAADWLRQPNPALEGVTPITLLDNDAGALRVDELLGRIEYGLYS
jgi:putative toxin-antitoxin system antitoxin component (TIGR02293 family)